MIRALFLAAVLSGLLATPAVPADAPDKQLTTATPVEKIIAALHDGKMDYEKNLKATPFQEVMDDLAQQFGIKFVVNQRVIETSLEGARSELATTSTEGMSLATFLRVYLSALPVQDLTYLIRADHIEITTKEAAWKQAGLFEEPEVPARRELPLICVVVKDKPLSFVLDELRRIHGTNIVVDKGFRESLKTPITIQLLNVPADTALELIADQADLGVVRKGNTFRLTSNP